MEKIDFLTLKYIYSPRVLAVHSLVPGLTQHPGEVRQASLLQHGFLDTQDRQCGPRGHRQAEVALEVSLKNKNTLLKQQAMAHFAVITSGSNKWGYQSRFFSRGNFISRFTSVGYFYIIYGIWKIVKCVNKLRQSCAKLRLAIQFMQF